MISEWQRRSLQVVVSLALVASSLLITTAGVKADDSSNGFTYTTTFWDVTVTGCDGVCPAELIIPEGLSGRPVVAIAEGAFQSSGLTSVSIPRFVHTIGAFAFQYNAIRSLTFEDGVSLRTIGVLAFNINNLNDLVIPATVTHIGYAAFRESDLTSVRFLGDAPTYYGPQSPEYQVFGQNPNLTAVSRSHRTIGWASNWNWTPISIENAAATATDMPSMSGTVAVGKTLTAVAGKWDGFPAPTFTYQWYTCSRAVTAARSTVPSTCKAISNARSRTFKITSAQRNKFLAVFVTGTSLGTTPTSWLTTTSVDLRATATVKPSIKGTARVGSTLTAVKGTWKGYPTPTFTYQWYACIRVIPAARSTMLATCTAIPSATSSTFKLTSAQRGIYVAVLVTGKSQRTNATTWLTKTTAEVK